MDTTADLKGGGGGGGAESLPLPGSGMWNLQNGGGGGGVSREFPKTTHKCIALMGVWLVSKYAMNLENFGKLLSKYGILGTHGTC